MRVTILDGDDPVTKVLIFGKRSEEVPSPKLVLPDKNAEYKVEWAQCANEHATAAVSATKAKSLRSDGLTAYDCGEAKPYKTATLATKKGDASSHALTFEAPPTADCWKDAMPEADAGVPDAAPVAEVSDAGAEVSDASASDAEAPDAEVTDASSATDAAPAKESGDKPAEKPADKPTEKKADKPAK